MQNPVNLMREAMVRAIDRTPAINPPDNGFYAEGTSVGNPGAYRFTGDGFGYGGNAGMPYSVPRDHPDTMWQQPAFAIFPPNGNAVHTPPDCDEMARFNTVGSSLPTWFRPANRAAASGTGLSGKPEGLRMMIVPPDRFNTAARAVRTAKDVRGSFNRPSRARTPTPPVGA